MNVAVLPPKVKTGFEAIPPESKPYAPRGAAKELFKAKDDEVILDGAAGTGKSRACLEKIYLCGLKYPGMRALLVRKTRESLTQSGMVTLEQWVLPENGTVHYKPSLSTYDFYNGSKIIIGGMDKASKIMSTEYDMIYVQEATELSENDWESLTTRCRNGVMPYNQVIGDCNPGAPSHWIKQRADRHILRLINSHHEDNPVLYDERTKTWTARGAAYIAKLDRLSGVRFLRLRKGIWAAAEGIIYEEFDPQVNVILPREIPASWRRILVVDFGYINPFVAQWWALDEDDRMYLYREIYMTKRLVSEHAALIKELTADEVIEAVVCDWDAENRATLEEAGFITTAASKAILSGIDTVKGFLKPDETGKPKMFLLKDALYERDEELFEDHKPVSTEQEFEGYVWSNKSKEAPVGVDDHGMDATRYAAMYVSEQSLYGGIHV